MNVSMDAQNYLPAGAAERRPYRMWWLINGRGRRAQVSTKLEALALGWHFAFSGETALGRSRRSISLACAHLPRVDYSMLVCTI